MNNLKQMNDRDSMEAYLDQFKKAELVKMATEINLVIPSYYTKGQIKNVITEFYMFQVVNRMIANRTYQYTIDDIETAIERRSE